MGAGVGATLGETLDFKAQLPVCIQRAHWCMVLHGQPPQHLPGLLCATKGSWDARWTAPGAEGGHCPTEGGCQRLPKDGHSG